MKMIIYFALGILFGTLLIKGEAASWFRMQEMFHFQGFQIFGIFMTAIPVGAVSVWLLKRFELKTTSGEAIHIPQKKFHWGYIIGSALFGIGWGLTGACPGPIFAQIGAGISISIIMLLSALAGTWVYSLLRNKLPH
jgi:uncharacterized membrane protein YedE/YeeE